MHLGEGPRVGQVWKKKPPDDWLKINKDSEEPTYINGLTISLLRFSSLGGRPHPFSLGMHLCLASILTQQTVSLCALPLVIVLCL